MRQKLFGLFSLVDLKEREEIVTELNIGLVDLYDSIEDVRASAKEFERSIDRILYGDSRAEDECVLPSCYDREEKPVYKRMD